MLGLIIRLVSGIVCRLDDTGFFFGGARPSQTGEGILTV
jgi:hypothetical protein